MESSRSKVSSFYPGTTPSEREWISTALKVLVLNHSYQPLHFCTLRRAVVLLIKGKAEEIEYDGQVIRSASLSFRIPTVIRLMTYIHTPYRQAGVRFSKKNVFKRDKYTCQYCGSTEGEMTIDHVIPKSRGGTTCWENVVVACQKCNLKKSDQTLKECGLTLLRKPKEPHFLLYYKTAYPAPSSVLESWNKYLLGDFHLFPSTSTKE
ncbi:MAG: HNH endonuclease [Candidatus Tectomicrobia bacterium]|uniref:HNH endonuclease n=1 Tax=Tectimicrobiota bacterium TaxID=2528274 RepID=A0A932G2A5_UNCTE|nr:HNH endonuclease [Candidatus Tectomicrobia bacterium]